MNIKNTLKGISDYYRCTRQCGHTHTLLNGVVNSDIPTIIVTHTGDFTKYLKSRLKNNDILISISSIENDKLRGHKKPLVIDNAAMMTLCDLAVDKIEDLEESNTLLVSIIDYVAKPTIDRLENENKILKDKLKKIQETLEE